MSDIRFPGVSAYVPDPELDGLDDDPLGRNEQGRVDVCINADGVSGAFLAAIGKAIEKERPGAVCDTNATCCAFHFRGVR